MKKTMNIKEFVEACVSVGYCSKDVAKAYVRTSGKTVFDSTDFEEAFRLDLDNKFESAAERAARRYNSSAYRLNHMERADGFPTNEPLLFTFQSLKGIGFSVAGPFSF